MNNLFDGSFEGMTESEVPRRQPRQDDGKFDGISSCMEKFDSMRDRFCKEDLGHGLGKHEVPNPRRLPDDCGPTKGTNSIFPDTDDRPISSFEEDCPSRTKCPSSPNNKRTQINLKGDSAISHCDSIRHGNFANINSEIPISNRAKINNFVQEQLFPTKLDEPACPKLSTNLRRSAELFDPEIVASLYKKIVPLTRWATVQRMSKCDKVNCPNVEPKARAYRIPNIPTINVQPSSEGKTTRGACQRNSGTDTNNDSGNDQEQLPTFDSVNRPSSANRNEDIDWTSATRGQSGKTRNCHGNRDKNLKVRSSTYYPNVPFELRNARMISRTKRSPIANPNESNSGNSVPFQGTANYVSCQSADERNGNIVVGFKENVQFNSPGYPDPYPNNVRCFFRFEVPTGKKVILTCPVFDLAEGDRLTIDGLNLPRNPYTGELLPIQTVRDFNMEFVSDAEGSASGFQCNLVAMPSAPEPQESDDRTPTWLNLQH